MLKYKILIHLFVLVCYIYNPSGGGDVSAGPAVINVVSIIKFVSCW